LRQLNLNEIRRDPQLEQLLKPITSSKFGGSQPPLSSNELHGQSRDQAAQASTLSPNGDKVPCPSCGYDNIPGLVICWNCGACLDARIKALAEAGSVE